MPLSCPLQWCRSGGFVEDEEVFVLEQNVERDFLGLRLGRFGFGPVNGNFFAGAGRVRWFDGPTIDLDVAFLDEPLDGTA